MYRNMSGYYTSCTKLFYSVWKKLKLLKIVLKFVNFVLKKKIIFFYYLTV